MATVAITATSLVKNTEQAVTQGAGTAIVEANTNKVLYPKEGKLLLWVDSDHADTALVIGAGDFVAAGKGSLTWEIGDTTAEILIVEGDRFKDSDGYISWTYATNSAGYVRAFNLP